MFGKKNRKIDAMARAIADLNKTIRKLSEDKTLLLSENAQFMDGWESAERRCAVEKEKTKALQNERDELIKAKGDINRELDAARKALDSLMVGINEEPTCDGCVRAGRYHSKCASCIRNPHAVDKWEDAKCQALGK